MSLARIYTSTPREAQPLVESLRSAGYKVEVVPPGTVCRKSAELEFNLDLESAPVTPAAHTPVPVVETRRESQRETRREEPAPAPHSYQPAAEAQPELAAPVYQREHEEQREPAPQMDASEQIPFSTRAGYFAGDVSAALRDAAREALEQSKVALGDMRENVGDIRGTMKERMRPLGGWMAQHRRAMGEAIERKRQEFAVASAQRKALREQARHERELARQEALQARATQRAAREAEREAQEAEQRRREQASQIPASLPALLSDEIYERKLDSHLDQIDAMVQHKMEETTAPEHAPVVQAEHVSAPVVHSITDDPGYTHRPRPRKARVSRVRDREWKIAFAAAGTMAVALILAFGLGTRVGSMNTLEERQTQQVPFSQPAAAPAAAPVQAPQSAGVTLPPAAPVSAQPQASAPMQEGVTITPGKGVTIAPKRPARRRSAAAEEDDVVWGDDVVVRHHSKPRTAVARNGVRRYTDVE